jgi:hypothetical protein
MMQNLIIGAGQLGSRHLQGMLKFNRCKQVIYVVDPSAEALDISRFRAKEIEHNQQIYFQQHWENIPKNLDLVIIATNADVREQIINQLFMVSEVNYLILEKVLFTDLMAYKRVSELLKTKSVKTWVNHPRRMSDSYLKLKQLIGHNSIGTYQVTGSNWGLGCNGLHFVDLFEFLSGSKIKNMDAEWIDSEILNSKRIGFVEFTGTIKGKLANGSVIQITSLREEPSAGTIAIFNSENRFIIQESGTAAIYYMKKSEAFKKNIIPFRMELQSSLTTKILNDLMISKSCNLPIFEDAKQTHELFMSTLLEVFNRTQKTNSHILPIT